MKFLFQVVILAVSLSAYAGGGITHPPLTEAQITSALLSRSAEVCVEVSINSVKDHQPVVYNPGPCVELTQPVTSLSLIEAVSDIEISFLVNNPNTDIIYNEVNVYDEKRKSQTFYGMNTFQLVYTDQGWEKPAEADSMVIKALGMFLDDKFNIVSSIKVQSTSREGYSVNYKIDRQDDGSLWYPSWDISNAISGKLSFYGKNKAGEEYLISEYDLGKGVQTGNQKEKTDGLNVSVRGVANLKVGDNIVTSGWQSPLLELNVPYQETDAKDAKILVQIFNLSRSSVEFGGSVIPTKLRYRSLDSLEWTEVEVPQDGKIIEVYLDSGLCHLELVYEDGVLNTNREDAKYNHYVSLIM